MSGGWYVFYNELFDLFAIGPNLATLYTHSEWHEEIVAMYTGDPAHWVLIGEL